MGVQVRSTSTTTRGVLAVGCRTPLALAAREVRRTMSGVVMAVVAAVGGLQCTQANLSLVPWCCLQQGALREPLEVHLLNQLLLGLFTPLFWAAAP